MGDVRSCAGPPLYIWSTRDEALENTREAILGYLEAAEKEGIKLSVDIAPAELVQIAV